MPPALQFTNVVGSFYEGYDNAMKRYAQQQSLANNIEDRAFLNEQRRQDAEWRSLDRDRKRKKWESEDNQHSIFSQIDLTLPYIANKDKIKKLPADKQQAIIAFYAKTPADQRKRLAEIQNTSREFIVNTFPKIRDEQTYQQVRAMAPQFLAQNGATEEEIQRIMQTSLPPKYDPRNIETLLAMAGYKPTERVLAPGSSLAVGGEIVATAPERQGQNKERPHVAALMAQGWMPGTRITGPLLDSIEAAAAYAEANNIPFGPEEAKRYEFEATKNRSTGRTAGSRLVIARKHNIETAFPLLDDIEKTGKKLNYSDVEFIGKLQKWKKGQLNDPLFTEYMTQRADALFVLGNALKQNGLTDKSLEVEEEAARPTMSPRALNAWLNTQRRALNRAAAEIEADYRYKMHQAPVYPAGQGGAPTPENHTPTAPVAHLTPSGQPVNVQGIETVPAHKRQDITQLSDDELLRALGVR